MGINVRFVAYKTVFLAECEAEKILGREGKKAYAVGRKRDVMAFPFHGLGAGDRGSAR